MYLGLKEEWMIAAFLENTQRASGTEIIGKSPRLQLAILRAIKFARQKLPILITGKTGTGKELLARAIHDNSPQSDGEFVAINCANLPAELTESELFGHRRGAFTGATRDKIGLVQEADSGTLLLDEISELPFDLQTKLLRLLQDGEFRRLGENQTHHTKARVIVTTNQHLAARVAEGKFRSDLYYRLNVLPIDLPPLSKRTEDIPLLAQYFLEKINPGLTLSDQAQEALEILPWPGNVRELKTTIYRTAILLDQESNVDKVGFDDLQLEEKNLITSELTVDDAIRRLAVGLKKRETWAIRIQQRIFIALIVLYNGNEEAALELLLPWFKDSAL